MFSIKSWEASPNKLSIKPGEVHLWRVQLSRLIPQLDTFHSCLTEEEQQHGDRLIREEIRTRFFISHAILRLILSYYLEQPAREIQFKKASHGKPYLEGQSLQFNMTHSDDVALYAITDSTEIGVDVEYVKRDHKMDALVKRFFSERENEAYLSFSGPERRLAFYRAWTRKEAYLKAIGLGLSYPLNQFDVSLAPEGMQCLLRVEGAPESIKKWTLFSFDPYVDYLASIAMEAPMKKLITYEYNPA